MFDRECQSLRFSFIIPALFLCLSLLFTACGHSTATFLAKGEEYLKKRKFHDALMQFRSAAEADSDLAAAHWGLARAHENLGQFNETLDELRKTVERRDNRHQALSNYFLLIRPPMIPGAKRSATDTRRRQLVYRGPHPDRVYTRGWDKPEKDVVAAVNKAIPRPQTRRILHQSRKALHHTRKHS
jgi:tetratricopeptide (TPR) repeat protein